MMFIKISYDITPGMPAYPGNPVNRIEAVHSFEKGDHCSTFLLTLFNHNGTHIDAPNHFDRGGMKISDYKIEDFIFHKPCLVDIPKKQGESITAEDLSAADRDCDVLLLRTGFCRKRDATAYSNDNPWLSPRAAMLIRKDFKSVRALGIDAISIGSFRHPDEAVEAHRILHGKKGFSSQPLMIIEDLNLGAITGSLKRFFAIPLLVTGVDSMPCSAFIEV